MGQPLTDFLSNLAGDPALLASYKADPATVASNAGLSQSQVSLLASGNQSAITQAVKTETNATGGGDHTTVIVIVAAN